MFESRLKPIVLAAALLSAAAGSPMAQPAAAGGAEFVLGAIALVGTAYRHGGDRPDSGLDCSGLVRHVARGALGVELPRQAEAISRVGVEVDPLRLQSGDLVFFNTLGRPFSHVGVYVGDGQFVHAPARRGHVRIEDMSAPYWRARFDGARRLPALVDAETTPAVALRADTPSPAAAAVTSIEP